MNSLAPIVLFVYNRADHTRQVLEALSKNSLAAQSILYIYADGPKEDASEEEKQQIANVRTLIREKKWCGETKIIERESNAGFNNSIIHGITEILKLHDKVIVLEDDVFVSPGFLAYMNEALSLYEKKANVMHISGYTLPLKCDLPETFFYHSAFCWGWGTWKRAWDKFNDCAQDLYNDITQGGRFSDFSMGNLNYEGTLLQQMADLETKHKLSREQIRRKNTWAWDVCWSASVFNAGGLCLHPRTSLVRNIGFDGSGLHCKNTWASKLYANQAMAEKVNVHPIAIQESQVALQATKSFFRALRNPPVSVIVKEKMRLLLNKAGNLFY